MISFPEYHQKAAQILTNLLQLAVAGHNTLCSCKVKDRQCDISFKGLTTTEVDEAWIDYYAPGVPKTPQTHRRSVVALIKGQPIAEACNLVVEEINRIAYTPNIVVKKVNNHWFAYIEDKPNLVSTGQSDHLAAIGDLVMNHAPNFGFKVTIK